MTDYVVSSGQTLSGVKLSYTMVSYYYDLPDTADIQSGGSFLNSTVGPLANAKLESGGTSNGVTLTGGSLTVQAGGTATGTDVTSFSYEFYGYPSPIPFGTNLDIFGTAVNTSVTQGIVVVEVGGEADGVTENTGINSVPNIGTATGLTVDGRASLVAIVTGTAVFASGSMVTDASISAGGTLSISAGSTLTEATFDSDNGIISNSGSILVPGYTGPNQGLGQNLGGARLAVGAGGSILNGGTLEISAGGHGAENYAPGGGGILTLASGSTLTNQNTLIADGGLGGILGGNGGGGGSIVAAAGANIVNQGSIILGAGTTGYEGATPGVAGSLTISSGATLTNSGTITVAPADVSGGPYASGSSAMLTVDGTLVLDQGQVTTGLVQGSAGSTLELASSGGAGTLSGLGGTYAGFGTVQIDTNANITFTGTDALAAGATLQLGAGSTVTNGALTIPSGGGTINFQGASTLDINEALNNATITGFSTTDTINLLDLSPGSYIVNGSGNDITVETAVNSQFNSQEHFTFAGEAGRHYALTKLPSSGPTGFPNQQPVSYALTLEPIATAIVAHADASGMLSAGNVVTFDLTTEVPVSFNASTGLPSLSLSDGGSAALDEVASTSTNLVFRTTVAGGQSTPDLKVTGFSLGGGTLIDQIGTTFDTLSVPLLAGSDTGIVVGSPNVTPPATVTGGVTVIGGASGTVFITPKAGSNSVTATATGNDTVISQGTDTIQAGGGTDVVYATGAAATVAGGTGSLTFEGATGNDLVVGGSGSNAIYGGTGSDTFFGGTGPSILVAGSGANTMLLAGVGNATLLGGLGKAVMMFGGPGADSFTGSSGGNDIMVGGAGGNSFSLTNGDVAFGGPIKADTFNAGNGAAMIITSGGGAQVNLGTGTLTSFEGSGAVNYNAGKGESGTTDIVGFTVHDHITLTDGFTAQDASSAFTTATKGSFGTTLNLTDGTKITVFGVNLTATQVSVG